MELLLVLFSFGLSPIDSFFLFYPPYVGGITAIPIDPEFFLDAIERLLFENDDGDIGESR
jgi:hypothetical protein